MIDKHHVSDQNIELKTGLSEGQSIICRVLSIDKHRFEVALSSRGSDLRNDAMYRNSMAQLGLETDDPYLLPDLDSSDAPPSVKKDTVRPSSSRRASSGIVILISYNYLLYASQDTHPVHVTSYICYILSHSLNTKYK